MNCRRAWFGRLGVLLVICLGTVSQTQEKLPQPAPVQENGPARALTLEECVAIGQESQPAVAAAQASLDSAVSGQRGVHNLPWYASLFSRDIPVRRHQAALGVTIASAGVDLAEWETRYAVIRNFFSVLYANKQSQIVASALNTLRFYRDRVKERLDLGDTSVSQIDLTQLELAIQMASSRQVEAEIGKKKAAAALREAMGVMEHCPLRLREEPWPYVDGLTCQEVVALALSRRGEITQAASALDLTHLEISAQRRLWLKLQAKTFAAGSDVHSRPIPQGIVNSEYRPGAIGLEMPVYMIGKRWDRVDRAEALSGRASAVVDKTSNLITLEAEASYFKWQETVMRLPHLAKSRPLARSVVGFYKDRFAIKAKGFAMEEFIRVQANEELVESQYYEMLYLHALSLAGLERVTAGGVPFPVGGTSPKKD